MNPDDAQLTYFCISELKADENATQKAAASATNRMQQIVGEAAYLFDGEVLDPFSARLIAVFPSARAAVDAVWKARCDLIEHNASSQEAAVEPTLVVHCGEVVRVRQILEGEAFAAAEHVASTAPPLELLVSAEIVDGSSTLIEADEPALLGEAIFFVKRRPDPEPAAAPGAEPVEGEPQARVKRVPSKVVYAAAAAIILIVAAAGFFGSRTLRQDRSAAVAAAESERQAREAALAAAAKEPRVLVFAPFAAPDGDARAVEQASMLGGGARALLAAHPALRFAPAGNVVLGGEVRAGEGGLEVVPSIAGPSGRKEGPAMPFTEAADAAAHLAAWYASALQQPLRPEAPQSPESWRAFVRAAALSRNAAPAKQKEAESLLRQLTAAEPRFVPLQLLAAEFHGARREFPLALAAARNAAAAEPREPARLHLVASLEARTGETAAAAATFARLLEIDPGDAAALEALGRYALAAGEREMFGRLLERARAAGSGALHPPDVLAAAARVDQATRAYFDIEVDEPENAALAYKIGRLSVIRRSLAIADLELGKLEKSGSTASAHLLRAYIAAEKGDRKTAAAELQSARAIAAWNDEVETASADVAAILNQPREAVAALRRAAERGEPTYGYLLASPLFEFLASESGYAPVRKEIEARRRALAAALRSSGL
jgi:hypothetical protein